MRRLDFTFYWMVAVMLIGLLLINAGCSYLRPQKGGTTQATLGTAQTIVGLAQPENPAQGASQTATRTESRETPISTPSIAIVEEKKPDGTITTTRTEFAPQIAKETLSTGTSASVGAAQKDTGREIAAKLASFQWVQYIGTAVLILGAFAFFHPVARKVLGGKDSAMALGVSGLIMIFGPYLFVAYGHWFALTIIAFVLYWGICRLKYKEGIADTLSQNAK